MALNVLPGLSAGYLYQRKAFWITSALATIWVVLGAALGQGVEVGEELQKQLVGLVDFVALAAGTEMEADLAVKTARETDKATTQFRDASKQGVRGSTASRPVHKSASEISVENLPALHLCRRQHCEAMVGFRLRQKQLRQEERLPMTQTKSDHSEPL